MRCTGGLPRRATSGGQQEKRPSHSYYRTLYGNVDRNLDIALACCVVFEEVVLPERLRWYELGPEIVRVESLRDLETELRRLGLR